MKGWIGVVAVAMSVGCVFAVGGGESEWSFTSPTRAEVQVANGDINARSSLDDRLVVRWDGGGLGDNARPDVRELANGTVIIDADGGIAGGGTVDLDVPPGTTLDLVVDRGSIDVMLDEPTSLFACVGAGSIDITVPEGPYRLEVGAGIGVISTGIIPDPSAPYVIEVCVGAGDVQINSW